MIVSKTVTINGTDYTRTYSDSGYYIINEEGDLIIRALDPMNSGRTYTESEEAILEMNNDEDSSNESNENDNEEDNVEII